MRMKSSLGTCHVESMEDGYNTVKVEGSPITYLCDGPSNIYSSLHWRDLHISNCYHWWLWVQVGCILVIIK